MKHTIYQSPKTKLQSTPVAEHEKDRHATLRAAGWTPVSVFDDQPTEAPPKKDEPKSKATAAEAKAKKDEPKADKKGDAE